MMMVKQLLMMMMVAQVTEGFPFQPEDGSSNAFQGLIGAPTKVLTRKKYRTKGGKYVLNTHV